MLDYLIVGAALARSTLAKSGKNSTSAALLLPHCLHASTAIFRARSKLNFSAAECSEAKNAIL